MTGRANAICDAFPHGYFAFLDGSDSHCGKNFHGILPYVPSLILTTMAIPSAHSWNGPINPSMECKICRFCCQEWKQHKPRSSRVPASPMRLLPTVPDGTQLDIRLQNGFGAHERRNPTPVISDCGLAWHQSILVAVQTRHYLASHHNNMGTSYLSETACTLYMPLMYATNSLLVLSRERWRTKMVCDFGLKLLTRCSAVTVLARKAIVSKCNPWIDPTCREV